MADKVVIPGYRIESVLGYGGMSTVYLAVQESLGRGVALKVMSSALAHEPAYSKRFLKEARIIAQLNHPNIIVIYDYGVVSDQHFIAMEHLTGGSLVKKIQDRMTVRTALGILQDLAKALHFAHTRGYIHRDIKPGNILFRDDGSTVLSDFGLAKGVSDATHLTATGVAMGTPAYMSPEQAYGDEVDVRSDLYSLGCVFYYMLVGRKPYDAENVVALAMKHLREPIPKLPHGLETWQPVIDRMLAKDPAARFQSAADLLDELASNSREEATPLADSVTMARKRSDVENLIDFEAFRPKGGGTKKSAGEPGRADGASASGAMDLDLAEPSREAVLYAEPEPPRPPPAKGKSPVAEPRGEDFRQVVSGGQRALKTERTEFEIEREPSGHLQAKDPSLAISRFREKVREESGQVAVSGRPGKAIAAKPQAEVAQPSVPAAPRSSVLIWVIVAAVAGTLLNTAIGFYLSQRPQLSDRSVNQTSSTAQQPVSSTTDLERFSDRLEIGGTGPEMVVIPPGEFRMGDVSGRYGNSARPVRSVAIPKSFAIGSHEVTFDDYDKFAGATGRARPQDRNWGRGRHPAIYVSWEDAVAYAQWLSQETGGTYRLPSEAEWEYAARAGSEEDYWWGMRASHEFANYGSDVCCTGLAQGNDRWQDGTAEVGSFADNPFGLHDSAGNVWEWVSDCWNVDHFGAASDSSPRGTGDCTKRVVKGGSWSDIPRHVNAAARGRAPVAGTLGFIGFRLVKELH